MAGEIFVRTQSAMHASNQTIVLIVGHGSRDPLANREFEALVAAYRSRHPELDVRHAYVELAEPLLGKALCEIAASGREIIVLPLFLFAAGHVKNDIPLALAAARRSQPSASIQVARPLGVHAALADIAFERAASVLPLEPPDAARTAVVFVGRGASDPDANGDFCKLARLYAEGRNLGWLLPCFVGITRPRFEEMLEFASRIRPDQLLVQPYFLFAGKLVAQIHEQAAQFRKRFGWIKVAVAPHLGIHEKLLDLLDERFAEARKGQRPLPCDNCQYRTVLPGHAADAGGLRALLWSLRHSFTHGQAAPHIHAHRPLRKHVLVCTNVDCAARGSVALVEALRRLIKDAGRERDFRVTVTSCMGRCGEGPTVAVYPDGIWYRSVQIEDADDLVQEHLLADRLVARLVDNIMQ